MASSPLSLTPHDIKRLEEDPVLLRYRTGGGLARLLTPEKVHQLRVIDLTAIIKFFRDEKHQQIDMLGKKSQLVATVKRALWPWNNLSLSQAPPPPPPRPTQPMGARGRAPIPAELENLWTKLPSAHHLNYELINPCASQWVSFPKGPSGRALRTTLSRDVMSPTSIAEDAIRFHLYLYDHSRFQFLTGRHWKEGYSASILGAPVTVERYNQLQPFLDVTHIKDPIFTQQTQTGVVHVTTTFPHYFQSGLLAVVCFRRLPMEQTLCKVFAQTLRHHNIKDLPELATTSHGHEAAGYSTFKKLALTSLERAKQLFQEHVASKPEYVGFKGPAAQDDDIEMGNQVLSFQDPLTLARINLPCKGRTCNHAQCFDCEAFISMNQGAIKWKCPICSKPVEGKDLLIDPTFTNTLTNYPDADRCIILPNGLTAPFETSPAPRTVTAIIQSPSQSAIPNPASTKHLLAEVIDVDDVEVDLPPAKQARIGSPKTKKNKSAAAVAAQVRQPILPAWSGSFIAID
ncbi:uncharacterized protein EV422DRAFT_512578 [Fimicolochytrium jonesii]|uniref:uncharacterized protein n=1 Tax=Fimicolochytrium jonesii TaxID=1396493 RepID=UPI0022FF0D99|nr:uncharacterized protein EV422DRAFT_512578 [Fimicolochytrium jonesii]KAI8827087.1 hypothetical protein EV422DRAFT_512578 [Fimicolochytrium jonesii]